MKEGVPLGPDSKLEKSGEEFDLRVEQSKSRILSSKEYTEQPFAHSDDYAYSFEVTDGEKSIDFYGCTHSNDPDHPQFAEISQRFADANPEIVFIEGMHDIHHKGEVIEHVKAIDLQAAMRQGENFYTLKLAIDAGINYESPEMNFLDELSVLQARGFSEEDIFTFYTNRQINQYIQSAEQPTSEQAIQYIASTFKKFRQRSGWAEDTLEAFERTVLKDIDVQKKEYYRDSVDPMPWENRTRYIQNDVSAALNEVREKYIFEQIAKSLKTYDRIFVVYGSAHAVNQEPAFRALLERAPGESVL